MIRILTILLHPVAIAALIVGLMINTARSATDGTTMPLPGAGLEIVVIEAPNCNYCAVFRRDVWPAYKTSARATEAPMRFIDINDAAFDRLGLSGPVTMVPTAIILAGNHEIGRISGTIAPENFFQTVRSLIAAKAE